VPDAFARTVCETRGPLPEIRAESFSAQVKCAFAPALSTTSKVSSKIPPRILSDQYINIFFQEWAPLLPVLHRPTFLRVYEQYIAEPGAGKWQGNKQAVAQLFLIFDIAALSSSSCITQSTTLYESQWRKAMQSMPSKASLSTLQCHVLAQLYYLLRADHSHCIRHRAAAISMCHQLGLHHSQKYYTLSSLELETRKKVFWCQYTLDKYVMVSTLKLKSDNMARFISASSGFPTFLRESDISTEYPADVDDENLTEQGISPALPGELTKMSSALALFRICRILSRALDQLLPASASYQFSMKNFKSISDELDQWLQSIPSHLRMQFLNDKPSAGVVSDRSPLLV
jgi:Fungal specific transcription factor domain